MGSKILSCAAATTLIVVTACTGGSASPTPAPTRDQTPPATWQNPGSSWQAPPTTWQPPANAGQLPAGVTGACPVCGAYTCVESTPGSASATVTLTLNPSNDPMSKSCFAGGDEITCSGTVIVSQNGAGTIVGTWQAISNTQFNAQIQNTSFDCTLGQPG